MKTGNDNDFEIVRLVKEGDASAFRLIVERYKDVSFSLACSILHNEQDAEDALQESFIKVFRGLGQFRFQSGFATWLYKIVVNTCNSKFKTRKKQQKLFQAEHYQATGSYDHASPFDKLLVQDRKVVVNRILSLVREEESLLLRLYYLAEMDIREIKEITGFSESKVKVTLYRARQSFYKEFQKIFGNEMSLIQ
jgi:RNA polymerase sigma-70 factor (ECF subfamily)